MIRLNYLNQNYLLHCMDSYSTLFLSNVKAIILMLPNPHNYYVSIYVTHPYHYTHIPRKGMLGKPPIKMWDCVGEGNTGDFAPDK